jgi:hypothetical protein
MKNLILSISVFSIVLLTACSVNQEPIEIVEFVEVIVEVPVEVVREIRVYPEPSPEVIATILKNDAEFRCDGLMCTRETYDFVSETEIFENVTVFVVSSIKEYYDLLTNKLTILDERTYNYRDARGPIPVFREITYDHIAKVFFETNSSFTILTFDSTNPNTFDIQALHISHGQNSNMLCTDSFSEACKDAETVIIPRIEYYFDLFDFYGINFQDSKLELYIETYINN